MLFGVGLFRTASVFQYSFLCHTPMPWINFPRIKFSEIQEFLLLRSLSNLLGRTAGMISLPACLASRLTSRLLRLLRNNVVLTSLVRLVGLVLEPYFYQRVSFKVTTSEWSSCAISSRCSQNSMSHRI